MGRRFTARQHPELNATRSRVDDAPLSRPVFDRIVLALLAVDGVISAVVGALLLPSYVGSIPFPISALLSGALNAALVWAAMQCTESLRLAALPMLTWLATVAIMTLGGPGGDVVFGGDGVMAYSALLFMVLGALPPALLLRRSLSR
ncbi:DUF6113 family protein [Mycobacterium sp. 141]|uniref:DUF6113 family protein n=1 Tax=Mycobacterium sp. 141 TaxID=1120797 RepID=UPI00036F443D|nr:DUF6113 family protein [Mycobacterium sp. 141]